MPRVASHLQGLLLANTRYFAVATELARRISDGTLRTGERLAGEHELARAFGVSRVTVRSALGILAQNGLVVKRAGSGTFIVRSPSRQEAITLDTLQEQFLNYDLPSNAKLLDYRYTVLTGRDARIAGMQDAVYLSRLFVADRVPFALTRSYLHPDSRKISHEEAERTPSYVILEKVGHIVARADMRVKAERVDRQVLRLLEIAASERLLVLDRMSFSAENQPLEHTKCYLRSETFEFALSVRGHVSVASSFAKLQVSGHEART